MSNENFPATPPTAPVESRRARIIRESNDMSKIEERNNPYGEVGNKIDATAGASHPFIVTLMMLNMALALQLFFAFMSWILVSVTDNRVVIEDDDSDSETARVICGSSPQSGMNMVMFSFNMMVSFAVFMLWHKARIEEALFLEKAGRTGNKQPLSEIFSYLPLVSVSALVIQLVAVIIDIKNPEPLGGGYRFLVWFVSSSLILAACIIVVRVKRGYTIPSSNSSSL